MTLREAGRYLRWLKRHGFGYPYKTLFAVQRSKINPAHAAVLLKKETGGGRNVFGCDHGPGRAFCHEKVTKEKVAKLKASGAKNGIGPVQLTADAWVTSYPSTWKKVHRPRISMEAGFRGFKAMVDDRGLWNAAKAYNGEAEYADDFVRRLPGVRRSLAGAKVRS
jgi:hypothetical protein